MQNLHVLLARICCGLLLPLVICGCGASLSLGKGSAAAIVASPGDITFGNLQVGNTATANITLTNRSLATVEVSGLTISGKYFSIKNQASLPLSIPAGRSYQVTVQFNPAETGSASGTFTVRGNSDAGGNSVVYLSGAGMKSIGDVNSLSCRSTAITEAGTDQCTVKLKRKVSGRGVSVALSSSNPLIAVPGTITVPHNSSSANFRATISAVNLGQTITLTATADGASAFLTLQMGTPSTPSASILKANSTSISFGEATLDSVSTQTLTLTSAGTEPVTIDSATVSGTGFTATGLTLPATLPPGQSATLTVEFDPASLGTSNGALVLANNSLGSSTLTIPLTGTGVPTGVELNWNSPSSPDDPIAGYNVYRSTQGSSQFQLLNRAPDSQTEFTDSTAQTGQTYNYYVTSVDTSGTESTPSNTASVTIPGNATQNSYRYRSTR